MSARDDLLDALAVERQDQTWWKTPGADADRDDSELTTARRRKLLTDAHRAMAVREEETG